MFNQICCCCSDAWLCLSLKPFPVTELNVQITSRLLIVHINVVRTEHLQYVLHMWLPGRKRLKKKPITWFYVTKSPNIKISVVFLLHEFISCEQYSAYFQIIENYQYICSYEQTHFSGWNVVEIKDPEKNKLAPLQLTYTLSNDQITVC